MPAGKGLLAVLLVPAQLSGDGWPLPLLFTHLRANTLSSVSRPAAEHASRLVLLFILLFFGEPCASWILFLPNTSCCPQGSRYQGRETPRWDPRGGDGAWSIGELAGLDDIL